jgi:hypothetical protein
LPFDERGFSLKTSPLWDLVGETKQSASIPDNRGTRRVDLGAWHGVASEFPLLLPGNMKPPFSLSPFSSSLTAPRSADSI